MFRFNKDIAHKLKQLRVANQLTQSEVAKKIGMSDRFGHSYIARLEDYKIKKPYFATILNYLDAVGASWIIFITELSNERDRQEHKNIMSSVKLPPDFRMQKKLDRDTRLYETKIKPPINYYTKVDMELVRLKIEDKVRKYCQTLRIKDELIPHYVKFAQEIITVDKYKPVIDKYNIAGVSDSYLIRIQNIALKTLHYEEEKVKKQKPLRREKAQAMAIKYLQSRIKLAPVENAVNNLLVENNLTNHVLFNSYMNFGRECYRVYKKYYQKDQSLMKQELAGLVKSWAQGGLDKEMMEKIKETIHKFYKTTRIY